MRPVVEARSRDNARTPMQWSDADAAGFTDGTPWLDVAENYESVNVAAATADEGSIWHHYRRLIELRDERGVLRYGSFDRLAVDPADVFAYRRTRGGERLLVVATSRDPEASDPLSLAPYESRIYDAS